jgi:penicillin-binding protein 1C
MLSQMGVAPLLDLLRGLGFSTLDQSAEFYGYGLTLGAPEVRLDEMIGAYASLARGGIYLAPRAVLSNSSGAGSAGGDGVNEPTSQRVNEGAGKSVLEPRRVLSQRTAFWITDILSDNEARSFVFGRGGSLEFPFPVAAKTGTSQAYRDNWTLGYTREVTVGVWVGNFDGAPMKNSSGVTGAGPIFHEVMLAAERRALGRMPGPVDPRIVDAPKGMTPVRICGLSGHKETPECPSGAEELLPLDEVPPVCRWHVREGGAVRTLWPPEYRSWAAGREAILVTAPSPGHARHGARFAIENPPEGATYWIDPTLRPEFQALEFRAVAFDPGAPISWILDGVSLGERPAALPVRWPLKPGQHRLTASDRAGHRAEVGFTVK